MTSSLSGLPLSGVRLTIPHYGWPTAWVTLSTPGAAAVSETPGALRLEVAGLELVCTCVRQGTSAESRTVELVGGYGGWRSPVAPAGFRAGNLVSLSSYAADIARAAGERVEVAPGVDRKLGSVAARLGESSASALLSQACALPSGAPVVPWWVDLDGMTRLGPRSGSAVAYQATGSDAFGWRLGYAEDDARPLLPGATIGGRTIEELRIEGDGAGVTETVTLAVPGEEPRTFAASMRRLMLAIFGPLVSARTLYRYVVREVYPDGRLRAVPVRSLLAPDLDGLRVWPGIAGGRCEPRVGSEALIQFADGDPVASAACVVGFTPALPSSIGIPVRAELDADEVVLASGTKPVGRGGTLLTIQQASAGVVAISIMDPDGGINVWTLAGVALTVVNPPLSVPSFTIDQGRAEVLV